MWFRCVAELSFEWLFAEWEVVNSAYLCYGRFFFNSSEQMLDIDFLI